jgi:hypothetical protein
MPNNISRVKNFLKKNSVKGKDSPPAIVRQIVVSALMKNLAKTTPIKTGRLNGGWQISVGTPPSGETPLVTSRVVSAINFAEIDKITAKNQVFITNNVRYASFVEYGTSRNRPQRYLETALLTTRLELKNLGIKVNFSNINISLG